MRKKQEKRRVRRVVRGGSWLYDRGLARASFRLAYDPQDRLDGVSFRVLRKEKRRVLRGGSFERCWSWLPAYDDSHVRFGNMGFRVLRVPRTFGSQERANKLRGGSFAFDRRNVRCAYRYRLPPDVRYDFIGFRVLRKEKEKRRVVRGGPWDYFRGDARSSVRDGGGPQSRGDVVGFRVICEKITQNRAKRPKRYFLITIEEL